MGNETFFQQLPVPLTEDEIKQHLKELRNAGIVEAEREGTLKYYSIAPGRLDTVRTILGAL